MKVFSVAAGPLLDQEGFYRFAILSSFSRHLRCIRPFFIIASVRGPSVWAHERVSNKLHCLKREDENLATLFEAQTIRACSHVLSRPCIFASCPFRSYAFHCCFVERKKIPQTFHTAICVQRSFVTEPYAFCGLPTIISSSLTYLQRKEEVILWMHCFCERKNIQFGTQIRPSQGRNKSQFSSCF